MKITRFGVFETNSSSVHTITILSEDKYQKWASGNSLIWDIYLDELINISDADPKDIVEGRYLTYKQYNEYVDEHGFEPYTVKHRTESGDTIIVFGYSGYD